MRINGQELPNPDEVDISHEEIGIEQRTVTGKLYKALKSTKVNISMNWKGLQEGDFKMLQSYLFDKCEIVLFDKSYVGYISNLRFKHLADDYYSVSLNFKEE